jgi:CBS domain-containing protein/RNA polymerase-binding transcription factor DksA
METNVKPYMTGSPVTIEAGASALEALDLMIEHGIRHLPVVDAKRRVTGVLSFDDLRAAFPLPISLKAPPPPQERPALRELAVGEVMTYAPVTVTADAPLEEATQLMAERRIGCLPVVDEDGRLDGIVTETDLLHALVTLLWTGRRGAPARPGSPEAGLVGALRAERVHILAQLDGYERHEQEITESRRELPLDLAEHGAQATEAGFTEELAELAARRLRALEHALERAEQGKLSLCEGCGGRISDARLRALPGATLCIRCARKDEARRPLRPE